MVSRNFIRAVGLTVDQYLDSTTLSGFKFLLQLKGYNFQRCIWLTVLIANFGFSLYLVLYAWSMFTSNPTITTLESQEYPIWNVPFPAVAICSVNKFSRKAVMEYVRELQIKMKNSTTIEVLLEKMLLLGSLYDIGSASQDDALNFQEILDYYDANKNDGFYDIRNVMERLAPRCEDFMLRCQWQGHDRICKNLFTLDATSDGFCCTFNYDRFKYKFTNTKKLRTNYTGSGRGLVVLLNGSTVDYFYNNRNTIGFSVQLFSPGNFPDATTGNLREYILNPSREVYLKLLVTTESSLNSIRPYGLAQRKCLFTDERSKEYDDHYSLPECLTKCKLRSILALCNCVPFYAPADFEISGTKKFYCTLAHVSCLERYKVTWNTYKPQDTAIEGFEREQEDSLSCPDCLPLCSTTTYNFEATSSAIQSMGSQRTSWGLLNGIENLTDVSLLRIYFASTASVLYKTDVLYRWYEILGNFGGLLGLCLGCSILSLVELIYFFTVKLWENYGIAAAEIQKLTRKKNRNRTIHTMEDLKPDKKGKIPRFVYLD